MLETAKTKTEGVVRWVWAASSKFAENARARAQGWELVSEAGLTASAIAGDAPDADPRKAASSAFWEARAKKAEETSQNGGLGQGAPKRQQQKRLAAEQFRFL